MKKLSKLGGRQKNKYLQEECVIQLSTKDKKSCHQDIIQKQLRSERDSLMKENKRLHKQSSTLQNQVSKLAVVDLCLLGVLQGENFQWSPHQGIKRIRKDTMWSEGYSATQVKIVNTTARKEETIVLNIKSLLGPGEDYNTETEVDVINMMLYIKDKYNISGGAYISWNDTNL